MAEIVRMMSVNALINQTKAAWDRADEKKADADDWYIRVGRMLVELKGRCEHGQWLPTLERLGRSKQRAHELMELARGTKTVEEQRGRKRDHARKVAQRSAIADFSSEPGTTKPARQFPNFPDPEEPDDEYYGGAPQAEERWQNSLANLCGDLIARANYWDREFPGWEEFECPSHIRKLVMEAATALASITAKVAKRDRKAG
jgi:hypothetical protein